MTRCGNIGVVFRLYWDNGEENGNYSTIIGYMFMDLGCWVYVGFRGFGLTL